MSGTKGLLGNWNLFRHLWLKDMGKNMGAVVRDHYVEHLLFAI